MIARIGRTVTASYLDVDCAVLDGWSGGRTYMPDDKLLALIDLIDRKSRH